MTNGNGRPISKARQVQFIVALTLLAWATQTLRHQWAFGSEAVGTQLHADAPRRIILPQADGGDSDDAVAPQSLGTPLQPPPATPAEQFLSATNAAVLNGTLEMRSDATIVGSDLKLKQVCRWTGADQTTFAPLADFVIDRFKPGVADRSITLKQLRTILQEAGVNMSAIDFAGASTCKITRSDVLQNDKGTPDRLVATAVPASATLPPGDKIWRGAADKGIVVSTDVTAQSATSADGGQFHNLREKLLADLALRTKVPADTLEVEFRPQDEKTLVLAEPQFQFDVQSTRVRNLGDVSWTVTILAAGGSQKVTIDAVARAWQNQLVVARPIASRAIIRDEDFISRRVLIDTLNDEPLLSKSQLLGQQSSRDLSPATVLTARMIEAVPMVRSGEFVTITLARGAVVITTVGRAMENGAYGQSIRVKNEATRDVYQVTMNGPQTAVLEK